MTAVALALYGGPPVRSVPVSGSTVLTSEDLAAAQAVLASGVLAGPDHPEVRRFETELARFCGVRHAAATSSGTTALHCLLTAMGVGPGDEVIVPALTFIATATPILMCGATPVIVDIEPGSYCIDPAAVTAAVTQRTKAVIAVHLNGHPVAVDLLPPGVPVVGDACQALGAELSGRPVCALGMASALSFWQDKLITTAGEGGAVVTDDSALISDIRLLRSHSQQPISGTANAHHVSLGYNYRLTGVQAAVGRSQLARFTVTRAHRRRSAHRLSDLLSGIPALVLPVEPDLSQHVYWKYVVALDLDQLVVDRDQVVTALRAEGIPAAPRYPVPLTRQPVLTARARLAACPAAESAADRLLSLPLPASPDGPELPDIAAAVDKVITAYRR